MTVFSGWVDPRVSKHPRNRNGELWVGICHYSSSLPVVLEILVFSGVPEKFWWKLVF